MATVISGTTGISANAAQFLIGQVVFMAGANAPSGFLKCNGQLVSRTTYASLFAVIGTTYGAGDGSTTFAVPDLRGEFVRGLDDGRGIDAGRILGSVQNDAMQDHRHMQGTDGTAHGGYSVGGAGNQSGSVGYADNTTSTPVAVTNGGAAIRTSAETRPRNVALLACIFTGV